MTKVESGKANKDDLAKERATIKSAREKSQKELGVKLFVGGISYDATDDKLRTLFATFGELNDVYLAMDKEKNRPKGFAFVTFAKKEDAMNAIKGLNNTDFIGRRISVEESNSSGRSRSKGRRRR